MDVYYTSPLYLGQSTSLSSYNDDMSMTGSVTSDDQHHHHRHGSNDLHAFEAAQLPKRKKKRKTFDIERLNDPAQPYNTSSIMATTDHLMTLMKPTTKMNSIQQPHCNDCAILGTAYSSSSCPHRIAGKRRCAVDGCQNYSIKGGVCVRHGAKKKKCSYDGCLHQVQKGGFCKRHFRAAHNGAGVSDVSTAGGSAVILNGATGGGGGAMGRFGEDGLMNGHGHDVYGELPMMRGRVGADNYYHNDVTAGRLEYEQHLMYDSEGQLDRGEVGMYEEHDYRRGDRECSGSGGGSGEIGSGEDIDSDGTPRDVRIGMRRPLDDGGADSDGSVRDMRMAMRRGDDVSMSPPPLSSAGSVSPPPPSGNGQYGGSGHGGGGGGGGSQGGQGGGGITFGGWSSNGTKRLTYTFA